MKSRKPRTTGAKLVDEMGGTTKVFGRDSKLSVVFAGKKASSHKGIVTLPDISSKEITSRQASLMRGFVDQQSGYVKYSDLQRIDDIGVNNPLKSAILRGIEDARITRLRVGEYMGSKYNMGELVNSTARAFKKKFDPEKYAENPKSAVPFAISLLGRNFDSMSLDDLDGVREKLPKEALETFDKYAEEIQNSGSFDESLRIADKIMEDKGEEDGEGETELLVEGDSVEDDVGEELQGLERMEIEEEIAADLSKSPLPDVFEIDERIYASDAYGFTNINKYICPDAKSSIKLMRSVSAGEYKKAITGSTARLIAATRKKLEYLLFSKIDRNWNRAQPEGRLDNKRVASIPTGNDLVFKTRAPRKEVDTAVSLIVDMSGSMYGSKAIIAQECVLIMSECLNKCGVNFQVMGFDDPHDGYPVSSESDILPRHLAGLQQNWRSITNNNLLETRELVRHGYSTKRNHSVHLYLFKDYPDRYINVRRSILSIKDIVGGNNYDAAPLYHAYNDLKKQPENRKVMFILSDGQPHSFCHAGKPTKAMIEEIENDRDVVLFGIGIKHDTSGMYKNSVVVDNVNDLAKRCFETLAKQI